MNTEHNAAMKEQQAQVHAMQRAFDEVLALVGASAADNARLKIENLALIRAQHAADRLTHTDLPSKATRPLQMSREDSIWVGAQVPSTCNCALMQRWLQEAGMQGDSQVASVCAKLNEEAIDIEALAHLSALEFEYFGIVKVCALQALLLTHTHTLVFVRICVYTYV